MLVTWVETKQKKLSNFMSMEVIAMMGFAKFSQKVGVGFILVRFMVLDGNHIEFCLHLHLILQLLGSDCSTEWWMPVYRHISTLWKLQFV
jgi:hypothetical protein